MPYLRLQMGSENKGKNINIINASLREIIAIFTEIEINNIQDYSRRNNEM
jgi:hypothetical protein